MEKILSPETEIETYVQAEEEMETVPETESVPASVSLEDDLNGGGIELYSAYDGSFSSTYLEYFRGLVSKLPPSMHYLCYRDGQYSYILYYSESLEKNGLRISGDADYYRLDTRINYAVSTGSATVSENIAFGMYYSDFDGCPSLMGGDYYVSLSLLYAVCTLLLFLLLFAMFRLTRCARRT